MKHPYTGFERAEPDALERLRAATTLKEFRRVLARLEQEMPQERYNRLVGYLRWLAYEVRHRRTTGQMLFPRALEEGRASPWTYNLLEAFTPFVVGWHHPEIRWSRTPPQVADIWKCRQQCRPLSLAAVAVSGLYPVRVGRAAISLWRC